MPPPRIGTTKSTSRPFWSRKVQLAPATGVDLRFDDLGGQEAFEQRAEERRLRQLFYI